MLSVVLDNNKLITNSSIYTGWASQCRLYMDKVLYRLLYKLVEIPFCSGYKVVKARRVWQKSRNKQVSSSNENCRKDQCGRIYVRPIRQNLQRILKRVIFGKIFVIQFRQIYWTEHALWDARLHLRAKALMWFSFV